MAKSPRSYRLHGYGAVHRRSTTKRLRDEAKFHGRGYEVYENVDEPSKRVIFADSVVHSRSKPFGSKFQVYYDGKYHTATKTTRYIRGRGAVPVLEFEA